MRYIEICIGRVADPKGCRGGRRNEPARIVRAMDNLRRAMGLRFRAGEIDDAAIEKIAAAFDQAAQAVLG